MLEFVLDLIYLRNRLSRHAEFGIAAGCAKLSFEVHAFENKQPACQKICNCCNRRPGPDEGSGKERVATRHFSRYLYSTMQSRFGAAGGPSRTGIARKGACALRARACPLVFLDCIP